MLATVLEFIVSVATALTGLLSVLGGPVWREQSETRRLTMKGWAVVICLLIPLPSFVLRELTVRRRVRGAEEQRRQIQERLDILKAANQRSNAMLAEVRALLGPAAEGLKEIRSHGGPPDGNHVPMFLGPSYVSTQAGQQIEFVVTVNDVDGNPDRNGHHVALKESVPRGAVYDVRDGLFSWTPDSPGLFWARFEASDGYAISTHEVAIDVAE